MEVVLGILVLLGAVLVLLVGLHLVRAGRDVWRRWRGAPSIADEIAAERADDRSRDGSSETLAHPPVHNLPWRAEPLPPRFTGPRRRRRGGGAR